MDPNQIREVICEDIETLSSKVMELLGNDEPTILASANLRSAAHILRGGPSSFRPYPPLRSLSVDASHVAGQWPAPAPPGQPVHPSAIPGPSGPIPPPMTPDEMRRQIALKLHGSGALPEGSAQQRMVERILAGDRPSSNGDDGSDDSDSGGDNRETRRRVKRRRRLSSERSEPKIPAVNPDARCQCGDRVGSTSSHPVVTSYGQDADGRHVVMACGNRLVRTFVSEDDKEVGG